MHFGAEPHDTLRVPSAHIRSESYIDRMRFMFICNWRSRKLKFVVVIYKIGKEKEVAERRND